MVLASRAILLERWLVLVFKVPRFSTKGKKLICGRYSLILSAPILNSQLGIQFSAMCRTISPMTPCLAIEIDCEHHIPIESQYPSIHPRQLVGCKYTLECIMDPLWLDDLTAIWAACRRESWYCLKASVISSCESVRMSNRRLTSSTAPSIAILAPICTVLHGPWRLKSWVHQSERGSHITYSSILPCEPYHLP